MSCDEFLGEEERTLRELVGRLGLFIQIEIHDYASEEGQQEYNQRLSFRRALRARAVLVDAGVAPSQITGLFEHGEVAGPRSARRNVIIETSGTGPTTVQESVKRGIDGGCWAPCNYSRTDAGAIVAQGGLTHVDCASLALGSALAGFVGGLVGGGGGSAAGGRRCCARDGGRLYRRRDRNGAAKPQHTWHAAAAGAVPVVYPPGPRRWTHRYSPRPVRCNAESGQSRRLLTHLC